MRMLKVVALVLAIALVPLGLGFVMMERHNNAVKSLDRTLATDNSQLQTKLEAVFPQIVATTRQVSQDPRASAAILFEDPSLLSTPERADHTRAWGQANELLSFVVDQVSAGLIESAGVINATGSCPKSSGSGSEPCVSEVAHVSNGVVYDQAKLSELRHDKQAFVKKTLQISTGDVYSAEPTVSPDTGNWVITFATPLPPVNGQSRGIFYFELKLDALREAMWNIAQFSGVRGLQLAVVDVKGNVIVRSDTPQEPHTALGVPDDRRFVAIAKGKEGSGTKTYSGSRMKWTRVLPAAMSGNYWYLVAAAPQARNVIAENLLPLALFTFALIGLAFVMGRRWVHTSAQALTDPLTHLGNRRKLVADLQKQLSAADEASPFLFALYDLDGFKNYNDTFGHPAGDALLARLARKLGESVEDVGEAYRMGGDEFCIIARAGEDGYEPIVEATCEALAEHGEGFSVGTSVGVIELPAEAHEVAAALHLADQRLYANKTSSRRSPGRQSADVLLQAMHERTPEIGDHLHDVAYMTGLIGARLDLRGEELDQLKQAAELHDVGKMAIPDAILKKPGPLDQSEWDFVRGHTVIGERIISAAPSLLQVSHWVRSSHERWNGSGYPDGLSGDEIPLPSRIIAVCDAFDAMIGPRPYRLGMPIEDAVGELRRCGGTQFDPEVVEGFCDLVNELQSEHDAAIPSAQT